MNNAVLRSIIADALESGVLAAEDWRRLREEVLADGLTCREEADLLIALDRSDPAALERTIDRAGVVDVTSEVFEAGAKQRAGPFNVARQQPDLKPVAE